MLHTFLAVSLLFQPVTIHCTGDHPKWIHRSDLNIMICPQSLPIAVFSLPRSRQKYTLLLSLRWIPNAALQLFSYPLLPPFCKASPFSSHLPNPGASYSLTLHPNSQRKNKIKETIRIDSTLLAKVMNKLLLRCSHGKLLPTSQIPAQMLPSQNPSHTHGGKPSP